MTPADKKPLTVKIVNKPAHSRPSDQKSINGDRPPPHCSPTVGDG